MDEVGKIIRQSLKSKNMSSTDFAEIVGLNPRTIDNIIHGKSRKASLLQRISTVLGINLTSYLMNSSEYAKAEEREVDTSKYRIASNIIFSLIEADQIICSKVQLNQFISVVYEFLCENHMATTSQTKAFAQGTIKFGLKNYIISSKATK